MPIARVQLSDGRIGRFEVPEGTTPEQVLAFAEQGIRSGNQPATQGVPGISKTESLARGALQGATFGGSDEAYGGIRSFTRDISRSIENAVYGDNILPPISYKEARNASNAANKAAEQANPGSYLAGEITGAVGTGVAGATTKAGAALGNFVRSGKAAEGAGALTKIGSLALRSGKGAAVAAPTGAIYGAASAEPGERIQGAATGAKFAGAIGAASPLVAAGAGAVKNGVIPVIDEAIKPLVQRARDFGIPLRADQVAPTRVRNTLQKVSQELPFSGVKSFEDTQQKAFTTAIAKTLGQESDNLGAETVNKFLDDASTKFDSILKGKVITPTKDVSNALNNISKEAADNISADYSSIVANRVEQIKKQLYRKVESEVSDKSGYGLSKTTINIEPIEITGEKLSSIRSKLIKDLPKVAGDARQYVADIVDALDDLASKNVSKEEMQKIAIARKEWRNFKTIEPLLEKATDGKINPTDLMNKVASSKYIRASRKSVGEDDLVDLARIGKEFMAKKGGSDTFQKLGLLGTGGAIATNPLLGIAGGAGVLTANRGLQAVNQSQKLIDAALRASSSPSLKITKVPVNPLIAAEEAVRN